MRGTRAKRAQFEIMGLAVLVVIIIIGAVFFIGHPLRDPSTSAADYEYDLLAQSTVDTFLRTDVGAQCPGYTMYDLIRDVLVTHGNPCSAAPDNEDSTTTLKRAAEAVVGNVTGSRYDFSIKTDEAAPTTIVDIAQCPHGRDISLSRIGEQQIRIVQTQTAVISLQFCPGAR